MSQNYLMSGSAPHHFDMEHAAKDVVKVVGLGLSANYLSQAHDPNTPHPRNPQRTHEGGLIPQLAPTGDTKHDLAMQTGQLATSVAAGWFIYHVWLFWAGITAFAIVNLTGAWNSPTPISTAHWVTMIIAWLVLQILYFKGMFRLFCGKKRKRSERRTNPQVRSTSALLVVERQQLRIPPASDQIHRR